MVKKPKVDPEVAVLEKIAAMPEGYREMGERLHELVKQAVPHLTPKVWYGMPGYANKEGKLVLFFRGAKEERYFTLGFQEAANLDEGGFWATSYALTTLTPAVEEQIVALVRKAAS
jgi:hypothetical protein